MTYFNVVENILSSEDVTVGGGSASAFSGAMAAGLIGMVARLSVGKDYGMTDKEYISYAEELDMLNEKLIQGVQKDADAYMGIVNAFKLPKSTEEEKTLRKIAVQQAGIDGATAPRDNAYLCKKVLEVGKALEGKSNTNAASDLNIGVNLAAVGVDGCIQNIKANLGMIKDEEVLKGFHEDINSLK
ncbi:MAG: cyclodeaminase/cyclohydrolase family protein [Gudongella sp.]|nr:cyclodeaminase/cyclohydrolase family protein [Gudongella sp.]